MKYRTTLIGAIVAVIGLGIAAMTTLSIVGVDARSTPAIGTIAGLVTLAVVQLLALLKTEKVEQITTGHTSELAELTRKVNGE